jgi:hypothetical protein
LLDEHGHIVDAHTFVAPSDEAALTLAYQYANGLDVDVWHRARRVGLIPREPKPLISMIRPLGTAASQCCGVSGFDTGTGVAL